MNNCKLHEFIIIPDQIPGIKEMNIKIRQRNDCEHSICNKRSYKRIAQTIINHPAKWEEKNTGWK